MPFLKHNNLLNMDVKKITTFGALKESGYKSKSIKTELRQNLLKKIKNNEPAFEGIHGYENTVIPELERAILSKHNINLLRFTGTGEDPAGKNDGESA